MSSGASCDELRKRNSERNENLPSRAAPYAYYVKVRIAKSVRYEAEAIATLIAESRPISSTQRNLLKKKLRSRLEFNKCNPSRALLLILLSSTIIRLIGAPRLSQATGEDLIYDKLPFNDSGGLGTSNCQLVVSSQPVLAFH